MAVEKVPTTTPTFLPLHLHGRWRVVGRPRGESATAVVLGGSESSFSGRALGNEEEVSMGHTPGAANAYRSPTNDPFVRRTANTFSSASDERRMREGWKHGVEGQVLEGVSAFN
uniref:Uncharacterized protein n=1 Tax=Oryza glaberrima TaxID=4538 RepID=I1QT18_ORYGL